MRTNFWMHRHLPNLWHPMDFPGDSVVKNLPVKATDTGDMGSIPVSGIFLGGGNYNLIKYSCLENPMARGDWWATVHGVTKSQTWLSDWACTRSYSIVIMYRVWKTSLKNKLSHAILGKLFHVIIHFWWYIYSLEISEVWLFIAILFRVEILETIQMSNNGWISK